MRVAEELGLLKLHPTETVDSMWGCFLEATDGFFYVAAGNHETYNGDVWLFRVNPEGTHSQPVMSVADILGTRAASTAVGEAKVHTRLYEDKDGYIYMGTMQGGIGHVSKWNHYTHPSQYEGGHLFRFDPTTDSTLDLGVPVAYEGIQTQVLDPLRGRLHMVTWPKKLFVTYDIKARSTRVHGVLAWSPTKEDGTRLFLGRDLAISEDGVVYSTNEFGCLCKYDPNTGELEDTSVSVMPNDSIRAHVRDMQGTLYFVTSAGYLYSLDTKTDRVTKLDSVLPDRAAYTPNLAITRDGTTLVYLAASHSHYDGRPIPLIEYEIVDRRHNIVGEVDARFFPPSCFGAIVDSLGRYVFALHGMEPSDSYLAFHDPKNPDATKWLRPAGTQKTPVYRMERKGSEGNTKGWIVTDFTRLSNASAQPIENGRSEVTALTIGIDGAIFGATTASGNRTGYLFRKQNALADIEILCDLGDWLSTGQGVRGLVCSDDGTVFGGTIDIVGDRWLEPRVAGPQFPSVPEHYPGGHLFAFSASGSTLDDLGIPVPGEGIYALCSTVDRKTVYALTFPHAHLVRIDTATRTHAVVAELYDALTPGLRPDEFSFAALPIVSDYEYEARMKRIKASRGIPPDTALEYYTLSKKFYVSRAIVCDEDGNVYGSHGEGRLFRYSPMDGQVAVLESRIPMINGTNYGLIAEPSVDSFVRTSEGLIYGGTTQDGYLFALYPKSGRIRNLGKPCIQGRVRGLTEWKGSVYGITGDDMGKAHLFRYDPSGEGLRDLGVLQGGGKTGFSVNRCGSIATAHHDRLYIGQAERISCLLHLDEIIYEPHQSP